LIILNFKSGLYFNIFIQIQPLQVNYFVSLIQLQTSQFNQCYV